MSDSSRDLLVRGVAAAKAGDKGEARFYLEWLLRTDASDEERVDAWFWLSEVTDDAALQREYIENILARNPWDPRARRKLAILDGRLNPDDIVDPDRLAVPDEESPQPVEAERFACPQCGARMIFAPDGKRLMCEHCGYHQVLGAAGKRSHVEEEDFFLAMATAAGHTRPVIEQAVSCAGCGASFVLAPEALSLTCPYCGSVQVVKETSARELIPPEGIIPFSVSQADAHKKFLDWVGATSESISVVDQPKGVYFPTWAFNLGGEVRLRAVQDKRMMGALSDAIRWAAPAAEVSGRANGKSSERLPNEVSNWPVLFADVLIPASTKLPPALADVVNGFDLKALAPYDRRYLADWPAEMYDISLSDASLLVRREAIEKARAMVAEQFPERRIDIRSLDTIGLGVDSFRLILLPLWMACCSEGGKNFPVVINGQTGQLRCERPRRGLRKLTAWLLGEE